MITFYRMLPTVILQYVTYSNEEFPYSSADEFPVMLIAEDICE